MFPMAVDQTRQDGIPTQHTLQVHMHHLYCPCSNVIYPYYPPGYRPQILPQPTPVARPSYLHHYQYTQLHVNPSYNVPLITQQSINQSSPSTTDLAFGPPPRDRRTLENQDYDPKMIQDKSRTENRDGLTIQYPVIPEDICGIIGSPPNSNESFMDLTTSQVAALSTENYITYLVNGCVIGERIAKRNEHRPCFKNIQNLCNRTRSEVVKPNITVSNIHSQGMPWATKDFIFAFVRAINCWCILRGYLGSKDGNLGKIDREISPEFRSCYTKWEKCTKQLTHYLIETFCKLDEANSPTNYTPHVQSNPGLSASNSATGISVNRTKSCSPINDNARKLECALQTSEKKEAAPKIPGILHIPPNTSVELAEPCNPTSESTEISPRDEESDNESRVYMKPGSYNVPTKHLSSQSNNTNSPRSLEFLETAQNVGIYQRKLAAEKSEAVNNSNDLLRDKAWQTAKNVTPEFIKQNEESSMPISAGKVEKLYEVIPHNRKIESWLNNEKNRFDFSMLEVEDDQIPAEDVVQTASSAKPKRCNSITGIDLEISSRTYSRKRNETTEARTTTPKTYSVPRRNLLNAWEYKNGGLTDTALDVLDRLLRDLQREEFAEHIKYCRFRPEETETKNPTALSTISKKVKDNKYVSVNEIVHDFRHLLVCAHKNCKNSRLTQFNSFRDKVEEFFAHGFPNLDFTHITGDSNEALGSTIVKQNEKTRKSADGDGDH